ncbi:NCS2 family permease [Ruminococcaceae bacterium OttesenSCG-928-D13]|nr:NCS2 family permease [Ruminococcaceae bacterium OttesenSCG-928-D13]
MEKLFKVSERKSTVRAEVIGGITTFFAMAYIILVNPGMLSYGDPTIFNGVLFATCLGAAIGTLLMAFLANMPFAQAPGMGLNAFFAFTVMPAMAALAGNPDLPLVKQYQMALALVFISGLLFLLITFIGAREAIIKGIPQNIKLSISGGIGLFIAYIGLQNSGLVVPDPATQVALINFAGADGTAVHGALLSLLGLVIIGVLYSLKIKGSILIGIVGTALVSYITGYSTIPENFSFNLGAQAKDFVNVSLFKMDFASLFAGGEGIAATIGTIIILVLSFSMVDMFDTIGTFLGTAQAAGLMDENGEMKDMKKGLLCDSIATTAGAALGTSTITTFVESSAGIGEGARTGLASLVTGALFIVALLLSPFVALIPGVATAPALIFVGCLMIGGLRKVNFDDPTESLPAFLTVAMMPLTYSIANGIAFGLISYVLLKLCTGKFRDIKIPTVVVSILFIIRFFVSI